MSESGAKPYPEVPAQPSFPALEERGARALAEGAHLRALGRAARRPGRTARTSTCSTTARPSRTGCRTTGTCSPATSRTSCRATRRCAATASSAASAGTATACRRSWRPRSELGISGRAAIHAYGIDALQRALPHVGAALHRASGSATSTRAGALGRLRERLQDHGPLLHGERAVGVQAAVGQGPALRGLPRDALLVGGADAALELRDAPRRQPTASARTRRSRCASSCVPEPATRSRPSCWAWTTTPWTLPSNLALAVGPELEYAVFEQDGARVILARRVRARSTRSELAGARARRRRCTGSELVGRRYGRSSRSSRTRRTPSACSPATSSTRRGHRHRAHGAGLRRGRPSSCAAANGHPGRRARWTTRAASPPRSPDWAGENVFEANTTIIRALKERGAARAARHDRAQLPALLAHRHAADLPRDELLVREGHAPSASAWSS